MIFHNAAYARVDAEQTSRFIRCQTPGTGQPFAPIPLRSPSAKLLSPERCIVRLNERQQATPLQQVVSRLVLNDVEQAASKGIVLINDAMKTLKA
jgi:hypothetical protein